MKHTLHVSEELNRLTKQTITAGDTAEFVEGPPPDRSGDKTPPGRAKAIAKSANLYYPRP